VKFTSKYVAYNLCVKEPEVEWYPDGRSRQVRPAIVVDFGEQALDTEQYEGFDGDPGFTQLRGGGYYDTDRAAKDKGWTAEEKQAAEQRLLEIAANGPQADYYRSLPSRDQPSGFGDVKLYERPKPTPPWPTYEALPPAKVAKVAAEMGLQRQALSFEERLLEEDRRPEVIEALRVEVERLDAEEELTAV
jgi:hypothetical protein